MKFGARLELFKVRGIFVNFEELRGEFENSALSVLDSTITLDNMIPNLSISLILTHNDL